MCSIVTFEKLRVSWLVENSHILSHPKVYYHADKTLLLNLMLSPVIRVRAFLFCLFNFLAMNLDI